MKTVFVTGAAGNLGQAICQKFLAEGSHVIGTTTNDNVLPFSHDNKFERIVLDLRKEDVVQDRIAMLFKKYENIDAAILTVGGFAAGKIEDSGLSAIEQQFQLNFVTTYNVARPIFLRMLQRGHGKIFLTSSRTGSEMRFSKGMTAYGLSKSLVFRLAELMNEEAKGTEVVTHVIAPSTIDTPENRQGMPNADFSHWVTPKAIADVIYDYCRPEFSVIREPVIKLYNKA